MDEVERRRFLETLRNDEEFRAAVRRELELEQLRELPEQVMHLTSAVNGLVDHQAELGRTVAELGRTVARLAESQERLQGDVAELTRIVGQTLRATTEGLGSVVDRLGVLEDKVDRGFTTISAHLDQLDSAVEELRNRRTA